ncbi:dual 3',5'-cyclic-AMP and -GMP phosphodiesterase 11-like isoform X5 [Branchiostoma floridae x Branchiostoma japonicum]
MRRGIAGPASTGLTGYRRRKRGVSMAAEVDEATRREYESMERWLDEHPHFSMDYFTRKATREMVNAWLFSQALSQTAMTTRESVPSAPSSGAQTPVRRVSSSDLESRGLFGSYRPILTTVDGTPSFIDPQTITRTGTTATTSTTSSVSTPRRGGVSTSQLRQELRALDEREMMLELVRDISNDLDVNLLCHKILQNVSILTNADRCSLFLVKGNKETGERYLVCKLFDVNIHSTLEEAESQAADQESRFPWGMGIVGYTAASGEIVNLPNAYQDTRFNKGIDLHTGYKTLSILSMPLRDKDGEVIGVAQVVNKCGGYGQKTEAFNEHDEKIFESYMAFCGVRLHNASLYEQSQLEVRRNQVLLELSRLILAEQSSLSVIINKVLMHTQSLLQCQRCQVLLLDDTSKGMFSQVFECAASDFEDNNMSQEEFLNRESSTTNKSARFPINIKITSHVALTGETLNIPDAYKDERFDPSDEEGSENKTRCILCMPIRNSTRNIIGVMQLVNKVDDTIFSKHDENLFEAFAIFCGMGIHNTQMYEKVVKAMAKQRVALECLSYHAVASEEEADRLRKLPIPSSDCLHLLRWDFDDIGLEDEETLKASIRMFMDMDYLSKFSINYKSLCRWMLSVRKNYRNVTYHNWRHAFNVAQMMFTMLKTGSMEDLLDDIEGLALLLACLCHDLDHRGTNNSFQMKSNHPLAQLYGTSTMERHHFDQCIMILTSEVGGTELLSSMSKDDYAKCLDVMEHAILSTDLALYFKWRGGFFSIVDKNEADWSNKDNRKLLRSMMMTACDVAAITKPWPVQQRVAQLVASEFFEQGDLEKEQLKIQPMDMMNREKKDKLPEMQVDFIDAICMPVYKYLAKALPSLSPLLKGCEDNRQHWQTLADSRKERQDAEAAGKDAPEVDGIDGEDTGKLSSGEKNESLEEELATVGDSPSRIILETGEEERNGSGGCCPERPTCAS